MDLNKLRKRIAEEQARLKRFEEQKKFSQINSEADFRAMMEKKYTFSNGKWTPKEE